MSNFLIDILEAAKGEPILSIVIGEMGWGDYHSEIVPGYAEIPKGQVLTWDEAKGWLDFKYSDGYGAPECMAIYAWTETRVLFVSQYDGSTAVCSIPRNPQNEMPEMPGGG